MNLLEHAISLLGIATRLAPAIERIVRAGVDADPNNPIAQRVAQVLPARSESEKAARDLRAEVK